jgi:hypothetical protein
LAIKKESRATFHYQQNSGVTTKLKRDRGGAATTQESRFWN